MRLDQYTAQFWPEYSRSSWQKFIKDGRVRVNGEVVTVPKQELDEDDYVQVDPPKENDYSEHTLPVLYEDDDVIVVDKPVGVLTHSKGEVNEEFTVADFFKPKTTYHADTNRPGIVHRLDRDTSGVLIGAKNEATASLLSRQFADRKSKKTYIAVVDGAPKEPEALIDLPIGRDPSKPSTFRVDSNGKSAQTAYRVLRSGAAYSLIELKPTTGRTHQLRVHMKYIGTPIAGDSVYGKAAERLYLHAHSLEVTLPGGKRTTFVSEVPTDFDKKVDGQ
ncbi:MAG TPA: RluA family pseudouridine synthase [Candidatus Saccharibacteria bacterium]|nr:RluA family pseudouridine synthase [Candidatus Saccharibacteria bacterium]